MTIRCIFACLLITMADYGGAARAQDNSPSNPQLVGAPIMVIIECGAGYTSHELYDARITTLEIVRGEKAWERIKEASESNEPPKDGFEYILVRVRFEYFARGFPGKCSHELRPEQFAAVSANGKEYRPLSVVVPKPELSGRLHSGDSLEGWIAFLVLKQDTKPMMTFSADLGAAVLHGGGVWFRLY